MALAAQSRVVATVVVGVVLGCANDAPKVAATPASAAHAPSAHASHPGQPTTLMAPASSTPATASSVAAAAPAAAAPPPRVWGSADLDPHNDDVVAPPEEVPDCHERLRDAGVQYREAELPLKQKRGAIFTCGASQAVIYLHGKGALRFRPRPLVTCQMALALARFEPVLQRHAREVLGSGVREVVQMGTYSCRKMARFPTMVSEHSYANAIDISSFVLESGARVTVARHFGSLERPPATAQGRFLRGLARGLFDEGVFSVVLTPFWDALHRDHFHLDLARYRVDGTRP